MFRRKKSQGNQGREERVDRRFSVPDTTNLCNIHRTYVLSLFCSTCDALVCTECVLSIHNGHRYSKIDEISQSKTRELVHSLSDIHEYYIPALKSKIADIEDCKSQNQKIANDKASQIDARFNKLVFDLKKIRDKYVSDIKDSQLNNEKRLNMVYFDLIKDITKLEGFESDLPSVLNSGSDVQKIMAQQSVTSALDNVRPGQYQVSYSFPEFHVGNIDSKTLQNAVGILESENEICSSLQSSQLKDKLDVKIISKIQHRRGDITAICPVNDDLVWVHGSDHTENEIINVGGSVQRRVDFGFLVVDFVQTVDNFVFAGDHDNARVMKLTTDGRHVKAIDTSPLKPLGICLSRTNDLLVCLVDTPSYYIDLRSRRMVARIDQDGNFAETYEYNEISRLFTKPLRVEENGNRDICVVDRTSSTSGQLVVLDGQGHYKDTYSGMEVDPFDPLDVKCDKSDRIIVTDGSRLIHLLDSQTNFIQYLLTDRDLIEKPWSLTVDPRRRIWVGCGSGSIYVLRCF